MDWINQGTYRFRYSNVSYGNYAYLTARKKESDYIWDYSYKLQEDIVPMDVEEDLLFII